MKFLFTFTSLTLLGGCLADIDPIIIKVVLSNIPLLALTQSGVEILLRKQQYSIVSALGWPRKGYTNIGKLHPRCRVPTYGARTNPAGLY